MVDGGASARPSAYQQHILRDEAAVPVGRSITTRSTVLAVVSMAAIVGGAAVLGQRASTTVASTPQQQELVSSLDFGEVVDLEACGAVADIDSAEVGDANALALQQCLEMVDRHAGGGTVVVSQTYTLTPTYVTGLSDVTLRIEGELRASSNITAWPIGIGRGHDMACTSHTRDCAIIKVVTHASNCPPHPPLM